MSYPGQGCRKDYLRLETAAIQNHSFACFVYRAWFKSASASRKSAVLNPSVNAP